MNEADSEVPDPLLINRLGGRTFLLTLGCGVATTVLCWHGKIDGNFYMLTIIATVGAYIGGNTVRAVKQDQRDAGQ